LQPLYAAFSKRHLPTWHTLARMHNRHSVHAAGNIGHGRLSPAFLFLCVAFVPSEKLVLERRRPKAVTPCVMRPGCGAAWESVKVPAAQCVVRCASLGVLQALQCMCVSLCSTVFPRTTNGRRGQTELHGMWCSKATVHHPTQIDASTTLVCQ